MKTYFCLPLIAALTACGSSNLVVLDPIKNPVKSDAVQISYENSTVGVPDDQVAKTKGYMEDAFFGGATPAFRNIPGGTTIRYGYLSYKAGSRVARYLAGTFGAGKAKMVLRAQFFDAAGTQIGQVQSDAEIGMGFFGGSENSAVKKAVAEVRNYAVAKLK